MDDIVNLEVGQPAPKFDCVDSRVILTHWKFTDDGKSDPVFLSQGFDVPHKPVISETQ